MSDATISKDHRLLDGVHADVGYLIRVRPMEISNASTYPGLFPRQPKLASDCAHTEITPLNEFGGGLLLRVDIAFRRCGI